MCLASWKTQFLSLVALYNDSLRTNPLLTKSLTSGVLAFAGALVSSYRQSNWIRATRPFTIYGVLFAGPVTHYFYNFLEVILKNNPIGKVLFERLVFCPIFLLFTLYILERLQGSSHEQTCENIKAKYISALKANWRIWTIPQLINLNFVPVHFRVLFANLVAFFWNIYLSNKLAKKPAEKVE